MKREKDNSIIIFLGLFMLVCLLLGLCNCASWTPTRQAIVRRQAASKLTNCLDSVSDFQPFRKECILESVDFCKDAGMEATCGTDEIWTMDPKCRK